MKRKNDSGMVMVEALIVVTIVVMFITVMLYLGMVLYQQSVVTVMANQTAASVAQVYGNTLRDPFTGYVEADGIHETVVYANMRNDAYYNVIREKADAFALYRLKSSRILNNGVTDVDVEIVPKKNELLKDQIVVTVKESYEISMVSFFGVKNNKLTFEGTGRADCYNLLEYLVGVPALGNPDSNTVAFTEDRECTVNFYERYGDAEPLKTVIVLQGYSINDSTEKTHCTMPTKPVKENMRFVKWITEEGHSFGGGSSVTGDMNVYGVWTCTVTFDPDGGKVTPTSIEATVSGNIKLPKAERENCTFGGWYTEKNGQGEEFTGENVQGDITVYAKWLCTVAFNPDGGDVSPDSLDVIYGQSLKQAGHTPPTPTRSKCTFAGWFKEYHGEGGSLDTNQPITGHTEVVVKWNCVVRFLDTNGKELFPSQTVVAGKTATMQTPTRAHDGDKGWQFRGWKASDGTTYNENSIISGNTDLYAQWICNHVFVFNRVKKPASCDQTGISIDRCKYCGAEQEGIIKGLGGHTEGEPVVVNAGCVSEGRKEWYCTRCNTYLRHETWAPLGHAQSGNCGRRHSDKKWMEDTDIHNIPDPEGHQQYWAACTVCPRCKTIRTPDVLCGTCYELWGLSGGWGDYAEIVDVPGHGRGLKKVE